MATRSSRPHVTQRTRESVIAAVRALLEEGAFHTSRVEDVAQRAGVSRASVYEHFGSRVGLVDALCESFDRNPALVAIRSSNELDEVIEQGVAFWAAEEKVLRQLYGAAAVDPAAGELVERQRRDRKRELRRVVGDEVARDRAVFARLLALTSFETFVELRRLGGLPVPEVARVLRDAAGEALRARGGRPARTRPRA
jgi:AcrR family transcriptional regulator